MVVKTTPDKNFGAQEKLIEKIRSRRKKYTTIVNGKMYVVYPDVFSPHYVLDSAFYAKHLPNQKGKTLLEVGSGVGLLAITAAFQGAKAVTAVDINPHAVKNTLENAKRHKVDAVVTAYRSDIFKNIPRGQKFDSIIWNVPWGDFGGNKRLNLIQVAFYDPGYRLLGRFISQAPKYLKPKGKLFIGFSTSIGSREVLEKFLEKAGFSWRIAVRGRFSTGHPAGAINIETFEAKIKRRR